MLILSNMKAASAELSPSEAVNKLLRKDNIKPLPAILPRITRFPPGIFPIHAKSIDNYPSYLLTSI